MVFDMVGPGEDTLNEVGLQVQSRFRLDLHTFSPADMNFDPSSTKLSLGDLKEFSLNRGVLDASECGQVLLRFFLFGVRSPELTSLRSVSCWLAVFCSLRYRGSGTREEVKS